MNKDDILVPILTAINDLREEVRENRREIKKNREMIEMNSKKIEQNREMIEMNSKKIERHEEESRKDRKAILDIMYSYEQVTNNQYEENKKRIEKLEQKDKIISA